MKRAQTATEYLILLSVILFIVGLAVSSLIDFPSLLNSVDRQSDSVYWDYSDIRILSHAQNSSHFKMDIQNALYEPINITQLIIDSQEYNTSYYLVAGDRAAVVLEKNSSLLGGDEYEYTIDFIFIQDGSNITFPGVVPIVGVISDS
jgi:hypothetical protein